MNLPDGTGSGEEVWEEGGFLLAAGGSIPPSELYDPATGKALLVPGAPVDPPPPRPDQQRVGIIDSGVLPDHPQLRNLVVAMRDFTGGDPTDRIGHGTLVAIQAVVGHHAAAKQAASIMPTPGGAASPALVCAKVTGPNGRIELEHVIAAIDWMATQGVQTVNLSLAFLGKAERHAALCQAIARHDDIIFTAAAGNFGPGVTVYPAGCRCANVISVGAVMEGKAWPGSGRGMFVAEGRVRPLPLHLYHHAEGQRAAGEGAIDEARASYLASLAVEENAPALYSLAVLDLHGDRPESAVGLLRRAAAVEPDHAEIEGHLGVALLMAGQAEQAIPHLTRAIELDPAGLRARKNLALTLARLGRLDDALAALDAARSLTAEPSDIDALAAELRRGAGRS